MAERAPVRLGILISGSGTNLQAIIDAVERGELKADIRIVISNRADAGGLERARRHNIPTAAIDHRGHQSREDFDRALAAELAARGVELVACAGFMRVLTSVMLDAFPNRIMNIHPALLPSFPGLHVQRAAVEHGARFSGCTVHFAAATVDDGPIIVQAVVPVYPDDDEEKLAARILVQEHRIYPYAIRLFQEGRLEVRGRQVHIKGFSGQNSTSALVNPPID
jgi:phosphoribosylglycinamide formyltransferase 1